MQVQGQRARHRLVNLGRVVVQEKSEVGEPTETRRLGEGISQISKG